MKRGKKFVPHWVWMVWTDKIHHPMICNEGELELRLKTYILHSVGSSEGTRDRAESLDIELAWNGTVEELAKFKRKR